MQTEARLETTAEGVKNLDVDPADGKAREKKAKESLAEFTAGAKYHAPSSFDLKIVALDYVLLGDYVDADKWLARSLEWNPQDSDSWYYLGRARYNENKFAAAVDAFLQCLKLSPGNVKAEDNLGLAYAGLGRNEEATAAYQQAMAWQSQSVLKNAGPYIDLGSLLLDESRPEEAVRCLLQAVKIAPGESRAHELLGKAYTRLDKLPEAQAELEKAVELSPQSANLRCMLAPVYRKRGMAEKAKMEFDRCAARSGSHSTPETPRP
jgi:tetratricopeptide (TPR) repeat protein